MWLSVAQILCLSFHLVADLESIKFWGRNVPQSARILEKCKYFGKFSLSWKTKNISPVGKWEISPKQCKVKGENELQVVKSGNLVYYPWEIPKITICALIPPQKVPRFWNLPTNGVRTLLSLFPGLPSWWHKRSINISLLVESLSKGSSFGME